VEIELGKEYQMLTTVVTATSSEVLENSYAACADMEEILQLLKDDIVRTVRVFTLNSAVLGLGLSGCGCCTVRVFTLNSAVLGLGLSCCGCCTVRVFRQNLALEDAIGSHACSLQANMLVTNNFSSWTFTLLPVDTVNCAATLKARNHRSCWTPG
jgi:hypothetical protein